jgi:hypothetical protein
MTPDPSKKSSPRGSDGNCRQRTWAQSRRWNNGLHTEPVADDPEFKPDFWVCSGVDGEHHLNIEVIICLLMGDCGRTSALPQQRQKGMKARVRTKETQLVWMSLTMETYSAERMQSENVWGHIVGPSLHARGLEYGKGQ